MDEKSLKAALRDLPLGGLRFYRQAGSTNDLALAWAADEAPDFSLVLADEQTSGRGRAGRKWYTLPGSALALSLILRPNSDEAETISLFSGLGALALTESLHKSFGLPAQIKWPNDVLVTGRKLAGILVESVWLGEQVESVVLGMGLNVLRGSVPPPEKLEFPATCLEDILKAPMARESILHGILSALLEWRPRLGSRDFLKAWEERLAYRGEQVQVWGGSENPQTGTLLGLEADGSVRLLSPDGHPFLAHFGDMHLRPAV